MGPVVSKTNNNKLALDMSDNSGKNENERQLLITSLPHWMLNEIFIRVDKDDRDELRLANSEFKNAIDWGPNFKRVFKANNGNFEKMIPLPPFISELRLKQISKTIPDNYLSSPIFLNEVNFSGLFLYENLNQLLIQAKYLQEIFLSKILIPGNPKEINLKKTEFLRLKVLYFEQYLEELNGIGDFLEFFAFKLPPFQLTQFCPFFLEKFPRGNKIIGDFIIEERSESTDWFFPNLDFLVKFRGQIEKMQMATLKILKMSELTLENLVISDFMEDTSLDLSRVNLKKLYYFQYLKRKKSPLFSTMSPQTNLTKLFLSCNYTFWDENQVEEKISQCKDSLKILQVTIFPEENSHLKYYDLSFLQNFTKLQKLAFLVPFAKKFIRGLPPSLTSLWIYKPLFPEEVVSNLKQILFNLNELYFIE